jgi:hypothetical protein
MWVKKKTKELVAIIVVPELNNLKLFTLVNLVSIETVQFYENDSSNEVNLS